MTRALSFYNCSTVAYCSVSVLERRCTAPHIASRPRGIALVPPHPVSTFTVVGGITTQIGGIATWWNLPRHSVSRAHTLSRAAPGIAIPTPPIPPCVAPRQTAWTPKTLNACAAAPHPMSRPARERRTQPPRRVWEQAKESTRNIEELKARDGPACLIPTIARDMHDAVSMNHESKGPPGKCGTSNPVRELSRLSMEQPCCHHACSHLTLMSNRNSMLHACIWNGVGSCNSHSCYGPG